MIQSDELIFFRGVGIPPTRYGFRFQSWLIAGYPEVGLVRYRQLVRYRPGSIDPFPTAGSGISQCSLLDIHCLCETAFM